MFFKCHVSLRGCIVMGTQKKKGSETNFDLEAYLSKFCCKYHYSRWWVFKEFQRFCFWNFRPQMFGETIQG